jgi:DNA-binding response OmpR family regulator
LDLVVSDLRLPDVDGLAIARHARAHVPSIPVILISAEDSDRTKAEARNVGVSAFLTKPVSNAVLRETVRRLLESAAPRSLDPQVG